MNRNKLGNCIDWVVSIVFSVCLWMIPFSIIYDDYLAATNFIATLVNVVLLMMIRKENGNRKK